MENNLPIFTVIFKDKTVFQGGTSYKETKWKDIPDKEIKRIFYKLSNGDCLCLDGYEKYYHQVEVTKDWMKIKNRKVELLDSEPNIEYVYIMGKKENKVISYRITMSPPHLDSKYRTGDITKREFDINDDKIKGLNEIYWK